MPWALTKRRRRRRRRRSVEIDVAVQHVPLY
jgi:hypothetical protein